MNNKQMKKATVDAINVMISHADKGPSGFWVEDHEGCGNPAVFPEFEEGLKRAKLMGLSLKMYPMQPGKSLRGLYCLPASI